MGDFVGHGKNFGIFKKCKILEGYEQGQDAGAQWNMKEQLEGLRFRSGSASVTLGRSITSQCLSFHLK